MRSIFKSRLAATAAGAAVLVTLGSTAAVATGLINSAKIRDGSVRSIDLRNGDVQRVDLAKNSVVGRKLAPKAVHLSDLAGGVQTRLNGGWAPGSVTGTTVADGSISQDDLDEALLTFVRTGIAPGDVGSAEIADGSITQADLSQALLDLVVTGIPDAAVSTAKIADGAVTDAKLADGSVTTPKLANDAVTSGKIANGTIGLADLSNAVTDQFGGGSVSGSIQSKVMPAKVVAHVGGTIATNMTPMNGKVTLQPGTYLVTLTGSFSRTKNVGKHDPAVYPQFTLWRDGNGNNSFQAGEEVLSPNALLPTVKDRPISVSGTTVLSIAAPTAVDVFAFGYDAKGGTAGSGAFQGKGELTILSVD